MEEEAILEWHDVNISSHLISFPESSERSGQFLDVEDGPVQVIHIKPADFGEGIIVRLQNFGDVAQTARLRLPAVVPKTCDLVTPDERDLAPVTVNGNELAIEVQPRGIQSVRLTF